EYVLRRLNQGETDLKVLARQTRIQFPSHGISFAYIRRIPDDSDPDLAALGPLIEDDLFHDEPKDLLALDHARRIPQFGKILTQRDDLSAVRRGKRYRLLAAPTLVFNIDLLRLPELVLPDTLQRPCHQTVLGFDGIILTARPLRLIARSLALERPLTLERAGFVLKLAESGNRESEAIGCQRFE